MNELPKQEVLPPPASSQEIAQPKQVEQRVVAGMPSRKALGEFIEAMPKRRFAVIDTHSEEGVLLGPYQPAEKGRERKLAVVDSYEEAELVRNKYQGIRGAPDFKIVSIDPKSGKQLLEN